jgi:hypothetical protein
LRLTCSGNHKGLAHTTGVTSENFSPDEPSPDGQTSRRPKAQPKAPRPAAVGPNGQPLVTARQGSHGRGLVIGLALVLGLGGWLLYKTAETATKSPSEVKLGSSVVEISRNEKELAKRVDRDGPRLYPGLAGTEADFWLTHVNNKWFAFAARPAGTPRNCNTRWLVDKGQFVDGCPADPASPTMYGPTGTGLPPYEVIVEDGIVAVKLKPGS